MAAIQAPPSTRIPTRAGMRIAELVPRSRSTSREARSATEAARATGKLQQRGVEGVGAEVRPQDVAPVELRVGRLPDQEIREALLAAGADDEVRVGQAGRVEG